MILSGIGKLALGKAKGIEEFSASPEGFTASLAPLIAFPLVGAMVTGLSGHWKIAIIGLLSRLCAILVLPVITYEFSRLFNRKGQWLRTATALNWCFWLVLPAVLVAAVLGSVAVQLGLSMARIEVAVLGIVGLYLLWNRWFILKSGLKISGWRALVILLAGLVITALISLLPLIAGLPLAGIDAAPLP